jgi:Zn-dependent peptidase ImmA (M78 family)
VLDAVARLVYIDRTVLVVKQTFLKLHETAHAFMPWQRDLYRVVEDCEKTISPEMSEQFDREANVFASEVLFQLETFTEEAAGYDFGILVPVKLHSKYGASIYSAVRRYVYTSLRPGGPGRFPAQGSHRSSLKEPVASRACRRFFGRGIFCTPDFSVLLASNRAST